MHKKIKPSFCLFLSAIFFYSNSIAVYLAEASIWEERKKAAQRLNNEETLEQPQIPAQLPSKLTQEEYQLLAQVPQAANLGFAVPDKISIAPNVLRTTPDFKQSTPKDVETWLSTLVLPFGSIRDIYLSKKENAPMIIHIQDAHEILEAQKNMASMIQGLVEERGIHLVGLEGAEGPFALEPYRAYPNQKITKGITDYFLREGYIGGPEFFGITATKAPLLWGIEDINLYQGNIKAYQDSVKHKDNVQKFLNELKNSAGELKEKIYTEELKSFDQHFNAYKSWKEGLGSYVEYLVSVYPKDKNQYPNLYLLLEALLWEKKLDFKQVEQERLKLVEVFAKELSERELSNLVQQSILYRLGRMTYANYYMFLKKVCEQNRISLEGLKQLKTYINYVQLADNIDKNRLSVELMGLEETAQNSIALKPAQKRLIVLNRDILLLEKLTSQAMTPEDWLYYKEREKDLLNLVQETKSLAKEAGLGVNLNLPENFMDLLKPSKQFCDYAVKRNRALVDNLLKKMKVEKTSKAIMIAGGFHSEGLMQIWREKGISYVVVAPKITEVPKDSHYLDIFARDPIPLEKLFAGEIIYLVSWRLTAAGANKLEGAAPKIQAFEGILASLQSLMTKAESSPEEWAKNSAQYEKFAKDLKSIDEFEISKEAISMRDSLYQSLLFRKDGKTEYVIVAAKKDNFEMAERENYFGKDGLNKDDIILEKGEITIEGKVYVIRIYAHSNFVGKAGKFTRVSSRRVGASFNKLFQAVDQSIGKVVQIKDRFRARRTGVPAKFSRLAGFSGLGTIGLVIGLAGIGILIAAAGAGAVGGALLGGTMVAFGAATFFYKPILNYFSPPAQSPPTPAQPAKVSKLTTRSITVSPVAKPVTTAVSTIAQKPRFKFEGPIFSQEIEGLILEANAVKALSDGRIAVALGGLRIYKPDGSFVKLGEKDFSLLVVDMVLDEEDNIYAATDNIFSRRQIMKYSPDGELLEVYDIPASQFTKPTHLVRNMMLHKGKLYYKIDEEFRALDLSTKQERVWGGEEPDRSLGLIGGYFRFSQKMVLNKENGLIYMMDPKGIRTFNTETEEFGDLRAIRGLEFGDSIAMDSDGNMYINDGARRVIHVMNFERGYRGFIPSPAGEKKIASMTIDGDNNLILNRRGGFDVVFSDYIFSTMVRAEGDALSGKGMIFLSEPQAARVPPPLTMPQYGGVISAEEFEEITTEEAPIKETTIFFITYVLGAFVTKALFILFGVDFPLSVPSLDFILILALPYIVGNLIFGFMHGEIPGFDWKNPLTWKFWKYQPKAYQLNDLTGKWELQTVGFDVPIQIAFMGMMIHLPILFAFLFSQLIVHILPPISWNLTGVMGVIILGASISTGIIAAREVHRKVNMLTYYKNLDPYGILERILAPFVRANALPLLTMPTKDVGRIVGIDYNFIIRHLGDLDFSPTNIREAVFESKSTRDVIISFFESHLSRLFPTALSMLLRRLFYEKGTDWGISALLAARSNPKLSKIINLYWDDFVVLCRLAGKDSERLLSSISSSDETINRWAGIMAIASAIDNKEDVIKFFIEGLYHPPWINDDRWSDFVALGVASGKNAVKLFSILNKLYWWRSDSIEKRSRHGEHFGTFWFNKNWKNIADIGTLLGEDADRFFGLLLDSKNDRGDPDRFDNSWPELIRIARAAPLNFVRALDTLDYVYSSEVADQMVFFRDHNFDSDRLAETRKKVLDFIDSYMEQNETLVAQLMSGIPHLLLDGTIDYSFSKKDQDGIKDFVNRYGMFHPDLFRRYKKIGSKEFEVELKIIENLADKIKNGEIQNGEIEKLIEEMVAEYKRKRINIHRDDILSAAMWMALPHLELAPFSNEQIREKFETYLKRAQEKSDFLNLSAYLPSWYGLISEMVSSNEPALWERDYRISKTEEIIRRKRLEVLDKLERLNADGKAFDIMKFIRGIRRRNDFESTLKLVDSMVRSHLNLSSYQIAHMVQGLLHPAIGTTNSANELLTLGEADVKETGLKEQVRSSQEILPSEKETGRRQLGAVPLTMPWLVGKGKSQAEINRAIAEGAPDKETANFGTLYLFAVFLGGLAMTLFGVDPSIPDLVRNSLFLVPALYVPFNIVFAMMHGGIPKGQPRWHFWKYRPMEYQFKNGVWQVAVVDWSTWASKSIVAMMIHSPLLVVTILVPWLAGLAGNVTVLTTMILPGAIVMGMYGVRFAVAAHKFINQNTPGMRVAREINADGVMRDINVQDLFGNIHKQANEFIVLSGGASKMSEDDKEKLIRLFDALSQVAKSRKIAVLDGGTQAGIMEAAGKQMAKRNNFVLVGVAPGADVSFAGEEGKTPVDPNHSYIMTVKNDPWLEEQKKYGWEPSWGHWGSETEAMYELFGRMGLIGFRPSVAIVANGGGITLDEVKENIRQGRRMIVIRGSGRAADVIASLVTGEPIANPTEETAKLAVKAEKIGVKENKNLFQVFDLNQGSDELAELIEEILKEQAEATKREMRVSAPLGFFSDISNIFNDILRQLYLAVTPLVRMFSNKFAIAPLTMPIKEEGGFEGSMPGEVSGTGLGLESYAAELEILRKKGYGLTFYPDGKKILVAVSVPKGENEFYSWNGFSAARGIEFNSTAYQQLLEFIAGLKNDMDGMRESAPKLAGVGSRIRHKIHFNNALTRIRNFAQYLETISIDVSPEFQNLTDSEKKLLYVIYHMMDGGGVYNLTRAVSAADRVWPTGEKPFDLRSVTPEMIEKFSSSLERVAGLVAIFIPAYLKLMAARLRLNPEYFDRIKSELNAAEDSLLNRVFIAESLKPREEAPQPYLETGAEGGMARAMTQDLKPLEPRTPAHSKFKAIRPESAQRDFSKLEEVERLVIERNRQMMRDRDARTEDYLEFRDSLRRLEEINPFMDAEELVVRINTLGFNSFGEFVNRSELLHRAFLFEEKIALKFSWFRDQMKFVRENEPFERYEDYVNRIYGLLIELLESHPSNFLDLVSEIVFKLLSRRTDSLDGVIKTLETMLDQRGQSSVEYGVIVALFAVVLVVVMNLLNPIGINIPMSNIESLSPLAPMLSPMVSLVGSGLSLPNIATANMSATLFMNFEMFKQMMGYLSLVGLVGFIAQLVSGKISRDQLADGIKAQRTLSLGKILLSAVMISIILFVWFMYQQSIGQLIQQTLWPLNQILHANVTEPLTTLLSVGIGLYYRFVELPKQALGAVPVFKTAPVPTAQPNLTPKGKLERIKILGELLLGGRAKPIPVEEFEISLESLRQRALQHRKESSAIRDALQEFFRSSVVKSARNKQEKRVAELESKISGKLLTGQREVFNEQNRVNEIFRMLAEYHAGHTLSKQWGEISLVAQMKVQTQLGLNQNAQISQMQLADIELAISIIFGEYYLEDMERKAEVEESLRNAFESYNQRMGELSRLEFADKPLELEWGRANVLEVSANMVTGDKFSAQESSAFDKLRAITEQRKSDPEKFGKDKPVVITVLGLDVRDSEIEATLEKLGHNAELKTEEVEILKNALKLNEIIIKSVTEENGLINKKGKLKGRINALALKNSLPKTIQKMTIFALNKDHWDLNGLEEGVVKLLVFLAGGLVQKIEKGVSEDLKRINLIKFQA